MQRYAGAGDQAEEENVVELQQAVAVDNSVYRLGQCWGQLGPGTAHFLECKDDQQRHTVEGSAMAHTTCGNRDSPGSNLVNLRGRCKKQCLQFCPQPARGCSGKELPAGEILWC